MWNPFKKKEPTKKPYENEGEKVFLCEFEGHKIYRLDANPMYCNLRYFYFTDKHEQITKREIPNDFFYAVADQIEAMTAEQLTAKKGQLVEYMRLILNKRGSNWYWITMAILEAFILIDDEPVLEMTTKHNNLKRELFTNNPEARFFFTNLAAQYLRGLISDLKDTNLESILNEMGIIPEVAQSIMSHLASIPFMLSTLRKEAE